MKMRRLGNQARYVHKCLQACASQSSFKPGYLSLRKCSLFSRIYRRKLHLFDFSRRLRSRQIGCRFSVAYVDTPRRLHVYASLCSFRRGGWAARHGSVHKIADGKRKKTCHMTCLFSNRQLSILPGRFQPSTFDV